MNFHQMRDGKKSLFSISIGIAFLALGGCEQQAEDQSVEGGQPTIAERGTGLAFPQVTRTGFEAKQLQWPLTVEQAELGCTKSARWAEVDGVKYGLNGTARGNGYSEIDVIWQIDKAMVENLEALGAPIDPVPRINLGDMISEAGKFCE